MKKYALLLLLACPHGVVKGQSGAQCTYWIDQDYTSIQTYDGTDSWQKTIDVSSYTDGFHSIHFQLTSDEGPSPITSRSFLKLSASSLQATHYRCWIDEDYGNAQTGQISSASILLDTQALADGFHIVHIMAEGDALSPVHSVMYLKMPMAEKVEMLRCVLSVDNKVCREDTINISNKNATLTIDVADISDGVHFLNLVAYTPSGAVVNAKSSVFVKEPVGGQGIIKYDYWLNDKATVTTQEVSGRPKEYGLTSLLPVPSVPIRSSCFHLGMEEGLPVLYAKNDVYVRFYDANGRTSMVTSQFVDYCVKQTVGDITLLESGVKQTTTKPTDNTIKWYKLDAEPGDSLQFRLDRAATVQLFAPSGEELLSASGSGAVNWFGCHVRESGTYYVALHDVTATWGNDISIDYNHIDKYDVLRQDVSVVGNGGCSTITFECNRFRDLYAVDLFNELGDTIKHVFIGHESDATTSVVFDYSDAAVGKYGAVFHFTEGDKKFADLVTVEEARDIELSTTVTYSSVFLRGTSTTYTIKITNKGNMTAYKMPLYVMLKNNTNAEGNKIEIKGLKLKSLFSDYDKRLLSNEELKELLVLEEEIGNGFYFISTNIYDEAIRDSQNVKTALFFVDIPPSSEKCMTFDVCVYVDTKVEMKFVTPKSMNPLTTTEISNGRFKVKRRDIKEAYCCWREQVECVLSLASNVANLTDFITAFDPSCTLNTIISISNCIIGALKPVVEWYNNSLCGNVDNGMPVIYEDLRRVSNGFSISGTVITCLSNALLPWKKLVNIVKGLKAIGSGSGIFGGGLNAFTTLTDCTLALGKMMINFKCPSDPDIVGGTSIPVTSFDPNGIYGYTSESANHAVKDGLTDMYYRIEFENDPEFATAAAHDIYVTDTLDATKFDLSTFAPTRINIGAKTAELTGEKNFVTTVDMRPEINAIAQVEGTYDETKGIAKWHISSLDPMTMEPTTYVTDGVLPVNTNGNGVGEVMYDIKLKPGLAHGTEIKNRAAIVFDTNDAIVTPYWTNTVDLVSPESHAAGVKMQNDSTASVSIVATDELSGPWRYNVYVQYGDGTWFLGAENIPVDKTASVKVYEGIDHGFYTVVTDSAGNVEQKAAAREFSLEVFAPQVNTNTKIQLAEGWNWMSQNQNAELSVETVKPKAQRIMSQTEEVYKDSRFGWTGVLDKLLPTQMYKVQATEAAEVQLSGLLFNASFRSIPLREGWNWIGYPAANMMTIAEAMAKAEAEEGDAMIGQDGLATYSGNQWTGTLTMMQPGQGYMYRSMSDKPLFLNATAQASSRKANVQRSLFDVHYPDTWTVDKRKYPNVMGMVSSLCHDGTPVANADEWLLGAFCGDECRGLAQTVGGLLMMNVYGRGGETILFYAIHRESGEIMPVIETVEFCSDLLGSVHQPYILNIGLLTGIQDKDHPALGGEQSVYDLQGRKVDDSQSTKGVYVVTDSQGRRTQKVIRK